ncbi:MAG: oligosaccharide flippase family protein, partial [Chloroflexota bacterium]
MMSRGGRLQQILTASWATLRADSREGVAQGSAAILLGHLARLALGLISSALLARSLGPEGFSVFSVVGAVATIGAVVADGGLSGSAVRLIAGDLAEQPHRAQQTVGQLVRLKLVLMALALALIWTLARPLAQLLNLPAGSGPTLISVAGLSLVVSNLNGLSRTLLHASRHFQAMSATQVVNVLVTLLLMVALFVTGRLAIVPALVVGIIAGLVAALFGWRLLPAAWRMAAYNSVPPLTGQNRELFGFARWLWLASIFWILAAQLDLLLLNRWVAPNVAGFYALALNLYIKADLVNDTLRTVLLPSVSTLNSKIAIHAYIRRSLVRSLLLAAVVVLALPLVRPFILTVYGEAYTPSVTVFYLFTAILLFDLLATPLLLLVYPLNLPRFIAAAD